jgi:hypothetical protein
MPFLFRIDWETLLRLEVLCRLLGGWTVLFESESGAPVFRLRRLYLTALGLNYTT